MLKNIAPHVALSTRVAHVEDILAVIRANNLQISEALIPRWEFDFPDLPDPERGTDVAHIFKGNVGAWGLLNDMMHEKPDIMVRRPSPRQQPGDNEPHPFSRLPRWR